MRIVIIQYMSWVNKKKLQIWQKSKINQFLCETRVEARKVITNSLKTFGFVHLHVILTPIMSHMACS